MARTDNLNNFLTDVAEAIRSKTKETGEILASEFDNKISNIQTGGGDISEYFNNSVAYSDGGNIGWTRLVKKIVSVLTINTSSITYLFAYYPNISIPQLIFTRSFTSLNHFLYHTALRQIDFTAFAKDIDTSNTTDMRYLVAENYNLEYLNLGNFNTSSLKNIDYICDRCKNLKNIEFGDNFDTSNMETTICAFRDCELLQIIPKLKGNKSTNIRDAFYNCNSLENFGGFENLGQAYTTTTSANYSNYNLDLHYSNNLTHDSLMNVINNLYDIATKGCNAQKLTLGSTNIAKLSEEEIAIATEKGWTVS